jgi:hypothetical protein
MIAIWLPLIVAGAASAGLVLLAAAFTERRAP